MYFYDKDRKQTKGKQQNLHSSNDTKIYEKISGWMEKLSDEELLQKINRFKSENKTIFYHHSCELAYLNDYNKVISDNPRTPWHDNRYVHRDIFNHIISTIEDEVLKERNCLFLSSLCDTYNYELEYQQKLHPQSNFRLMTNHYLEEKIEKYFKKKYKNYIKAQEKNYYSQRL